MIDLDYGFLNKLLEAREERAQRQKDLIGKYKSPIISFGLNIPGRIKDNPFYRRIHGQGLRAIERKIKEEGLEILYQEVRQKETGAEAFYLVDSQVEKVKRMAIDLENNHPLGRIFDIDVFDQEHRQLGRSQLGFEVRKCLICDQDSRICMREANHSYEKLVATIENQGKNYFAEKISGIAIKSLLYELAATPKPGLVDRYNCGSHDDMDFFTFIDSSAVLGPYFYKCALEGMNFYGDRDSQLLERIRPLGIQAEKDMFEATEGINSHKGAIFSLGLISAVIGWLIMEGQDLEANTISKKTKRVCQGLCQELKKKGNEDQPTYGERLYRDYGITGIRGEAESGFSTVINASLPILTPLMDEAKESANDILVHSLLYLIRDLEDSNIIGRKGMEGRAYAQIQARKAIELGGFLSDQGKEFVYSMDKDFIKRNISPGGAADLLALSLMLYYISRTL